MENIRQLIVSLMENMRRLDDQSVSHKDLLFVQMVNDDQWMIEIGRCPF